MAGKKSPDAYRTISEAAKEADLPAHVLRFWESKFTQLKPLKRNGGRRLYRPQDIQLLKGLRRLLYEEGFTIKGAQKYLRERGVAAVTELGAGQGAVVAETSPTASEDTVPYDEAAGPESAEHAVSEGAPGLDAGARARLENVLDRLVKARETLDEALQG